MALGLVVTGASVAADDQVAAQPTTYNSTDVTETPGVAGPPPPPETWKPRAPLPIDLYGGAATAVGYSAFIAGGYSHSTGQTLSSMSEFSTFTNTWRTRTPFPGPGAYMASAVYAPVGGGWSGIP